MFTKIKGDKVEASKIILTFIPISTFYQCGHDDHVVRFCFVKKKETLELAVERLTGI